jgi:short-subunit dehydrogenase
MIDQDAAALESLAAELELAGKRVCASTVDVRDSARLHRAVHAIERSMGPIAVLVPCAGVGRLSSAIDLDLDGLRLMLEVNVLGVANSIAAVLPGMFARRAGHIVGISSVAGYRGLPWMPGYSATKAALATYLEGLRPALKRRGVTITTVYPGFVRTAMTVDTPFRRPIPMLEPEEAAEHLVRAILTRPRDYTFPFTTAVGMGFLRRLPNLLFDRAMDKAGPRALTTEF